MNLGFVDTEAGWFIILVAKNTVPVGPTCKPPIASGSNILKAVVNLVSWENAKAKVSLQPDPASSQLGISISVALRILVLFILITGGDGGGFCCGPPLIPTYSLKLTVCYKT